MKIVLAVGIPIFAFVALVSWSLSSAVGSTPDDDFHLASIWCGLGDRSGLCENPDGDPVKRFIPTSVGNATCYAFHSDESAACWNSDEAGMTQVKRANVDGLYPRVFYGTMSIFASPNAEASVLAMRVFNAALSVGMLTAVFFALPRRLRPALVVSVAATAVPLGMFIYGSTNPSSWAFLSAATVWISFYGALQTTGRRTVVLLSLALFGVIIGAGARADAAVYAVFGVLIAVLLGARSIRAQIIPLAAAGVAAVISVAFYLSAWQGSSIVGGLESERLPLTAAQHLSNLLSAPSLWTGALGGWGLGWLDTPMPAVVTVLATAVFWGAVFVGLGRASIRRIIAVALAIAAMWLVPVVLLGQSRMLVGELIQPRYIVPLMIITVGVASARFDAASAWRGGRFLFGAAALVLANAVALHFNIQRYTTGTDHLTPDPGANAEWWWSAAPSPMVVWVAGSLSAAMALIGLWFTLSRASTVIDGGAPSPDKPRPPLAAGDAATSTPAADGATAASRAP